MDLRSLNPQERALLDFLLQPAFPGRDELAAQAATVRTSGSSCDCGCPSFLPRPGHESSSRPDSRASCRRGRSRDTGGKQIGVTLMVKDGYLFDVEVYDFDDRPWAGLPSPNDLKITQWSERDASGVRHALNP
jgi:hypothetical protein